MAQRLLTLITPGWDRTNVRFGSLADICNATADVRFTLKRPQKRIPAKVMSALPLKADICGATAHVR